MSTHRAARGLLAIAIPLIGTFVATPAARAQSSASATLTLVSQTAWTTPAQPIVKLAVRAENTGTSPLDQLTLGVTIGSAVRSRTAYEGSLKDGPGLPIFATTFPAGVSLAAGASRLLNVSVDLSAAGPGISSLQTFEYPLRVDLRSVDVPVAGINTVVIYLVRTPEVPMLLSTTIELSAPIAFAPNGRLADRAFEAAVAPAGALGAEVAAIGRLATDRQAAFDLVVEPALLDQLQRMSDGYQRTGGSFVANGSGAAADAATLLATLRSAVTSPSVHVSATPFAEPNVPALLASGLGADLAAQESTGLQVVRSILGVEPDTTVVRPPDGALNDAAVEALASQGATTILGNPDTVARPPQPLEFAPPPTASLAVAGQTVALVMPDPGAETLLTSPGFIDDPVLAAQTMLGELTAIWQEEPVPSQARGIAIALPVSATASFWGAFLERIAEAPFLRLTDAQTLVERIPPPAATSPLASPSNARFSQGYVGELKSEHRNLLAFRSMLVNPSRVPDRMGRDLLYAESAAFLGHESAGRAWIDQVNAVTGEVFARAVPDSSQVFTFTAATGSIPLIMGDPGNLPIRFTVQLRSNRLRFPDGARQTVTLTRPNQIVTFRATTKAAGQGQIQVVIRAPSGRAIRQTTLIVRSTAVNHIALAVTVAAALLLLALWSRRFFTRRRTT
jgi:hypothetical protein